MDILIEFQRVGSDAYLRWVFKANSSEGYTIVHTEEHFKGIAESKVKPGEFYAVSSSEGLIKYSSAGLKLKIIGPDIREFPNGANNPAGQLVINNLARPIDFTLDPFGNLYIAEGGRYYVSRWSVKDRRLKVIAGVNDKDGDDAEHLYSPFNIFLESKHSLYVSDYTNHRIQKFEFEGGDLWC
ncbi:unnamed protein product [Didymodactylos carnosus]|uniref:Uncharacterized protein n=1 Tax=Didymodactylos carnosus TaxID=1234261 RepID=A0A814LNJ9_9BILA|nr:unnamed protein product [Didymodactylos carnosus]CAF3833423.1 unnamed protein product [Didymodactylos carnosus]